MNVTVESISSIEKAVSVEVPVDRVDQEIVKVYKKIGGKAKIKGFRKGKIPQAVLEKYYQSEMQMEVLNNLFKETYYKALADNKIPAVSNPEITDASPVEKGSALNFTAKVEVRPDVEINDYKGLELQKEKFELDPEMVEKRLQEMREGHAEIVPVKRRKTARKEDYVVIDFTGYVDGEAFEGGTATDYQLELGSGSFIPGFEDQVVGMKIDEEKDIEVSFPEGYGNSELAGKPAVFKVTLKELKAKEIPEIDDDLAKTLGADSVDALRAQIEEGFATQEQDRIKNQLHELMTDQLIEKNPFEVPEGMIAGQLDYMLQNAKGRLQQQGLSFEMLGMNDDSFRSMYRDPAIKQLKGGLLLDAVANKENLLAVESDLDSEFVKLAEMSSMDVEDVKKYYSSPEAKSSLLAKVTEDKAVDFVLSNAKISEVSKEELAPADNADVEG